MESIIKNKKIIAINNGINVSNSDLDVVGVQDFKKEFCIPNNKKIICYIGRLDPEKRPDRFLEFAEKLFLVRAVFEIVNLPNDCLVWDNIP